MMPLLRTDPILLIVLTLLIGAIPLEAVDTVRIPPTLRILRTPHHLHTLPILVLLIAVPLLIVAHLLIATPLHMYRIVMRLPLCQH